MGPSRTSAPRDRRDTAASHGFTLLEAMLASVILVIAVAAFAQAVSVGSVQSAEMLRAARANLVADAVLEEVLSKAYTEPSGGAALGRDTGEAAGDRAAFDDIDDYHGFAEAAGELEDAVARAMPSAYAEFSRSVTVTAATALRPNGTVAGKKVVVTVESTFGDEWLVERFVGPPQ